MHKILNIYQIQWGDDKLVDGMKTLVAHPDGKKYFEYPTITAFLETQLVDEEYYGFFSPKFLNKKKLSLDEIRNYCSKHDSDVYIFNPFQFKSYLYKNILSDARDIHDSKAIEQVIKILERDFSFSISQRSHPVTWSYSNYWIAKGSILKQYLLFYKKLIDEYKFYEEENNVDARYKDVRSCIPFIFERLLTVFLNLRPDIRVKNYSEFEDIALQAVTYNEALFLKILDQVADGQICHDLVIDEYLVSLIGNSISLSKEKIDDVYWCPSLNAHERRLLSNDPYLHEIERFLEKYSLDSSFLLDEMGVIKIYADSNRWIDERLKLINPKFYGIFYFVHYYLSLNAFSPKSEHAKYFELIKKYGEIFDKEFSRYKNRNISFSDVLCACMFRNVQDAFNLNSDEGLDGFEGWLEENRENQFFSSKKTMSLPQLRRGIESLDYYYFPNHFGGIGKDGDLMLRSMKMNGNIKIRAFDLADFCPDKLCGLISEKAFFVAPAQELMKVKFKHPELVGLYKFSAAFIQWELEKIPLEFEWAIEGVNKIIVSSDFTRYSIPRRFDVQKISMPNLIDFKSTGQRPSGLISFVSMFDAWSYLERKNPYMAIEVYKKIDKKYNTQLLIKASNLKDRPDERKKILELIDGDPRITLLEGIMASNEVYELISNSHCMLSFQRSEGFGRTLLESLCLGTYVISNDYSGCQEFSNVEQFIKCKYHMKPVNGGYPYGDGQIWAETDFDDAVSRANLFCQQFSLGCLSFTPNEALLKKYSLANTAQDLKTIFEV